MQPANEAETSIYPGMEITLPLRWASRGFRVVGRAPVRGVLTLRLVVPRCTTFAMAWAKKPAANGGVAGGGADGIVM